MTNEEKKLWLGRYRLAGVAIQRLQEEIARWDAKAAALTARYDGVAGGGGDDPLQRAVEEMLALREELAEELRRQVALRREIEKTIAGVKDERLRELLRLRYLTGLTWENISEKLNYQYRWTLKLHGDALQSIEMHM